MNVAKVKETLRVRSSGKRNVGNIYTRFAGTLNIQVIRAENIQPNSSAGSSNPYVIIQYPESGTSADDSTNLTSNTIAFFLGNKNELLRTRVVYDTLNPSWDETFEILVNPSERLDIHVYSKNMLTTDGLLGVGILNLEAGSSVRNRIEDHQTHNFSMDLNPQGRIFLRLTHEGGVEDIDFWFRKSRGTFRRTRQDLLRIIASKVI